MSVKIVLGTLFGDEGKGNVVRWLARKEKDPVIVRFSGGPQSAHTVMSMGTSWKGVTHICSSFGAGVLEGFPTLYLGGYFDICSYTEECKVLEKKGLFIPPIYLGPGVKMMYPHDVYLGQKGSREKKDGTCGKGIYRAFIRPDTADKSELEGYWKNQGISTEEMSWLWDIYYEACREKYTKKIIKSTTFTLDNPKIVEGTQGLLLDMDHGFFPNVTPSNTGPQGLKNSGILDWEEEKEIYLVLRSYLTRHGNGYDPKKPLEVHNPHETNIYNSFQGEFKTGEMEVDLIRKALDRHNFDNWQKKYDLKINVVITCLDVHTPDLEAIKGAFSEVIKVDKFYGSWNPYSDNIKEL